MFPGDRHICQKYYNTWLRRPCCEIITTSPQLSINKILVGDLTPLLSIYRKVAQERINLFF